MHAAHMPIPQVDVEPGVVTPEFVENFQNTLSKRAIPTAVAEYYSYRAVVTARRPVFALLKCKSNKARLAGEELGEECSFIHMDAMKIFSVHGVHFGRLAMPQQLFQDIRCGLNSQRVIEVCERVRNWEAAQKVSVGDVFAIKTDQGKAGLMCIEDSGDDYVQLAACHFIV